ncbi:AAA family ATPase [Cellvibrio sp. pealriver]|uniref:AAA family ATPase n=1 Tax=Cellvibrio sp. pealriver TaxID=1622269 RepID=UPI001E2F83EC|nr:AAA family ATPase [Cellvibrio sp. pealriver]
MTREPPMRAEPDSRLLDHGESQQGYLFDEVDDNPVGDQLLEDYRQRYGLSEDPFSHDYSFPLFTGAGRRQLLDQLLHLCQFSNSVMVVLGEFGVGKTRIAHAFMDSLSDQDEICFISLRSGQGLEQVLLSIVQAFGLRTNNPLSIENLLTEIEAFIAQEAVSEDDGLAVVVLDNAHLLDDQSISVITSLLHNFPQQNRLHLALFGEPQLITRLERLSPESLLVNDFNLPPFSLSETVDYLNFRMEMADYLGPEIFTESMVEPWWRQMHGQLNVLHELAQDRLLQSVSSTQSASKRPLPVVHIIALSMLIAVVGVVFLYMGDDDPAPAAVATNPGAQAVTTTSTASSQDTRNLSSTETPVQPLMQSLPQPTQPNQQAAANPTAPDALPREEVVPLAQLPTSPKKAEAMASSTAAVMASSQAPVVEQAPASVPLSEPMKVAGETQSAKPVEKVVVPEPVKQKTTTVVSTAPAGSAQERNILTWSPSEFTIQLLGVSNKKAALDFIAAQPNKKDLLVFQSKRQGRDWFVVITGRYANSAQARQAIARLPAVQRDAGPWPRDVKTIQNEIKSAM